MTQHPQRRPLLGILGVTVALLAACGSPVGGSAAPSTVLQTITATPTPSGTPSETVAAATATPGSAAPRGVEGFVFGDAKWFDAWEGRAVQLKDGRAEVKGTRYSLGAGDPLFADVDGDGEKDALVSLSAEEGNGFSEYTYLWLWDAQGATPVQVQQPVTDDGRCGNVTTSIQTALNRITVKYLDRSKFAGNCAQRPTAVSTKRISLESRFLYQVEPQVSALTPCGPAQGSEGFTPGDLAGGVLQAAPDVKAPIIASAKTLRLWDSATDQSGTPKGWVKVMYVPREGKYDDSNPPCGFVKKQY